MWRELCLQVVARLRDADFYLPGYDPDEDPQTPQELPFVLLTHSVSRCKQFKTHIPCDDLVASKFTADTLATSRFTGIDYPLEDEFSGLDFLRAGACFPYLLVGCPSLTPKTAPRKGDLIGKLARCAVYSKGHPGLRDYAVIKALWAWHPCITERVLAVLKPHVAVTCRDDCPTKDEDLNAPPPITRRPLPLPDFTDFTVPEEEEESVDSDALVSPATLVRQLVHGNPSSAREPAPQASTLALPSRPPPTTTYRSRQARRPSRPKTKRSQRASDLGEADLADLQDMHSSDLDYHESDNDTPQVPVRPSALSVAHC